MHTILEFCQLYILSILIAGIKAGICCFMLIGRLQRARDSKINSQIFSSRVIWTQNISWSFTRTRKEKRLFFDCPQAAALQKSKKQSRIALCLLIVPFRGADNFMIPKDIHCFLVTSNRNMLLLKNRDSKPSFHLN